MNSEVKSVMVSVFALVIAAGFGTVNTAQIQETKEDVINLDDSQNLEMRTFSNMQEQIAELENLQYNDTELTETINNHDLAIYNHAIALYELERKLNGTINRLSLISNQMLVVQALTNKLTQAVPQQQEMFSLQLITKNGTNALDGEYLQSETVYISGQYDESANHFDIIFKRVGQTVLERSGITMPLDGIFSYSFNDNHDQPTGDYTVTVIINGKIDTISFEIL